MNAPRSDCVRVASDGATRDSARAAATIIELFLYYSMMPPTRKQPEPLSQPAQVRALASPARQEICDTIEAAGPVTIARLAELMGRPADALYFHVRRLAKVGLLVEREPVKEGRHTAAVFDVVRRPLRLSYASPVKSKDIARVAAGIVRLASRDFGHAVASGSEAVDGPRRSVWAARSKGWLTPEELERVNALLSEAARVLRGARPRPGARAIALSFVLAPERVSPRARVATQKPNPERTQP